MSEFWVLGVSLNENLLVSKLGIEILKRADVIVGESRKPSFRYLKSVLGEIPEKKVYLLDPFPELQKQLLWEALAQAKKNNFDAVLFSDCGMPILFDPGNEVLEHAKHLGFKIRCEPGPTSFATACAVSGFSPPFLIYGFLPQETQKRAETLKKLVASKENLVLMETPYRFLKILEDLRNYFGDKRSAFLAWEISSPGEQYFWGNLKEVAQFAEKSSLQKGEFVFILRPA